MAILENTGKLTVPEGLPTLLRDLIHEYTGIYFDRNRFDIMLEKIGDLICSRGHHSFMEFYYLLKYEDRNRSELQQVIEVLSVQETYFWREMGQVRMLVDDFVPRWFAKSPNPLQIWSAACATGEEPYTIAIALAEAGWANHPIEILASDASMIALGKAQMGLYRERSLRSLPEHLKNKYFTESGNGVQLSPRIMSRVRFQRANILNSKEIAGLSASPVIFCRNVFIYFSPDTIRRALFHFASAMPNGGHLFVGASESLLKLTDQFDLQEGREAFVYVRRDRAKASPA
jgi:chemotaxis protein methyltransferase CheR